MKIYGKSQKTTGFTGITIESLTKCVHSSSSILSNRSNSIKSKKKISLVKTQSFSTRSSSNALEDSINKLNFTLPHKNFLENPGLPKENDKKVFLDHLLEIFHNPEKTAEYFFINRGDFITFEEFLESLESLSIQEIYPENKKIFKNLAKPQKFLLKEQFFSELFLTQCTEFNENLKLLQDIRLKLMKTFGNYIKAFEEISCGSSFITLGMLDIIVKKLNFSLEKDQVFEVFLKYTNNNKMHFKEFKEFWIGKEGICLVKSCEETCQEFSLYCKKHFQCVLLRGEEIFHRLQTVVKREQLFQFFQQVLAEEVSSSINIHGVELQKREIQALKEILKVKNFMKQRNSTSVKNRL